MPAGTIVSSGALVSPGGQQGIPGPNPVQMPTGAILDFAGSVAPSGFLLCDGSAVSRTTYAALFAVLSTTFGTGDGSTTFNVPDCRSRTSIGAGQGTGLSNRVLAATGGEENHALSVGELAAHNHTGTVSNHTHSATDAGSHSHSVYGTATGLTSGPNTSYIGTPSGTLYANTNPATISINVGYTQPTVSVDNAGSGAAHNTIPPFIALNKIIKT